MDGVNLPAFGERASATERLLGLTCLRYQPKAEPAAAWTARQPPRVVVMRRISGKTSYRMLIRAKYGISCAAYIALNTNVTNIVAIVVRVRTTS